MLPFREEQQIKPDEMPLRWKIGIDQRQVALYVGLALVAGFTLGFVTARYIAENEAARAPVSARPESAARVAAEAASLAEFRRVSRILRADTVEVEGVGPVRMIGIETPDGKSQYLDHGKNALAFSEKMLLGQDVRLEFDPASALNGNRDAEGRTLAYLYDRDGTLVNKEMIRQGHAFVRVTDPFKMIDEFRALEREAAVAMRGVWGLSGSSPDIASTTPSDRSSTAPDATATADRPRKLSPLMPDAVGPNVPAVSGATTGGATAQTESVVFVSSSDRMYHKTGCEYLGKKKDAIPLSEARGKGYAAYGRCFASTVLKAP
jgi:micrococcal nuclease